MEKQYRAARNILCCTLDYCFGGRLIPVYAVLVPLDNAHSHSEKRGYRLVVIFSVGRTVKRGSIARYHLYLA